MEKLYDELEDNFIPENMDDIEKQEKEYVKLNNFLALQSYLFENDDVPFEVEKTVGEIIDGDNFTDDEFLKVAYNLQEDERAFWWVDEHIAKFERIEEWLEDGSEGWTGVLIDGKPYFAVHWYDQNTSCPKSIRYYEVSNGKCLFK